MSGIISNLHEIIPPHLISQVREELVRGWRMAEVKAHHESSVLGHEHKFQERKAIEGVGQMHMRVHADAYHYWGQKFKTYDCWKDKEFIREFKRDNPEVVVHNAKKTVVGGAIFDSNGNLAQ